MQTLYLIKGIIPNTLVIEFYDRTVFSAIFLPKIVILAEESVRESGVGVRTDSDLHSLIDEISGKARMIMVGPPGLEPGTNGL